MLAVESSDDDNKEVVYNSLMLLVLKFGGIWPCGLGVMPVQSWISEIVALCPSGPDSVFGACLT